MPAAMNIQPLKRCALEGIAGHNFRLYAPDDFPQHLNVTKTPDNKILHGGPEVPGALGELPERQPDTGRKIRDDANLAAAIVMTLPTELIPNPNVHSYMPAENLLDANIQAWTRASMKWLHEQVPGYLAYAVLHLDEFRPQIHALVIPQDEVGHISYKEHFGSPEKLAKLQESYSAALTPLSVEPSTPEEKEARKAAYVPGIQGWRAKQIIDNAKNVKEGVDKEREVLRKNRQRLEDERRALELERRRLKQERQRLTNFRE